MIDGISETVKTKWKNKKAKLLCIILAPLQASKLGNMFTGNRAKRAEERVVRAEAGFNIDHMSQTF